MRVISGWELVTITWTVRPILQLQRAPCIGPVFHTVLKRYTKKKSNRSFLLHDLGLAIGVDGEVAVRQGWIVLDVGVIGSPA